MSIIYVGEICAVGTGMVTKRTNEGVANVK